MNRFDFKPSRRSIVSLIAFIVFVSSLGALYGSYAQKRDHEAWVKFKADHHCVAVAHKDGEPYKSVSPQTKGPDIVTTGVTPSQTGWRCDDGVTRFVDDE